MCSDAHSITLNVMSGYRSASCVCAHALQFYQVPCTILLFFMQIIHSQKKQDNSQVPLLWGSFFGTNSYIGSPCKSTMLHAKLQSPTQWPPFTSRIDKAVRNDNSAWEIGKTAETLPSLCVINCIQSIFSNIFNSNGLNKTKASVYKALKACTCILHI